MQTRSKKSKKNIIPLVILCAGSLVVGAGCATIMSGTTQKVKISSVPDSANVKIERMTGAQSVPYWEGKTPTTAKLHRKDSYLVTISLDGYERAEVTVEYGGMNGWIWGNIAFGGILGIVVDAISGADIKLKPDEIRVELVALHTTGIEQKTPVYAVLYSADAEGHLRAQTLTLKPTATKQIAEP